jgi:hypothetical protein
MGVFKWKSIRPRYAGLQLLIIGTAGLAPVTCNSLLRLRPIKRVMYIVAVAQSEAMDDGSLLCLLR